MAVAAMPAGSLRQGRVESSRLAWAFALSLSLHLVILGTYFLGKKLHWWEAIRVPAWLHAPKRLAETLQKKAEPAAIAPREAPLLFVEVNPDQAVAQAPKEAKYYSNKNAVAANPEAKLDTDTPRITGTQKQVVKTEDVPREKFTPLQPTKPVAKEKPAQEELKAKPAYTPGDLAMAKPEPTLRKEEGKDAQTKPRTLAEARARQKLNQIFGQKMDQDGGVARHRDIASLDTKETPFGDYDAELVEAISAHWYDLLDTRDYASDGRGRVVIQFNLNYQGRITDLSIEENTVGEVLGFICEKAVQEPSPYKPWPIEMRRLLGETRHIQFTFYYN